MWGKGTIRSAEALGVPSGRAPLHAPLPLARGLRGVLRTVRAIPGLAVLDTWQERSLRRAIACERIRDDDAGHVGQALEELVVISMECSLYAGALVRLSWHMKSVRAPIWLASFLENDNAARTTRDTRCRSVLLHRSMGLVTFHLI